MGCLQRKAEEQEKEKEKKKERGREKGIAHCCAFGGSASLGPQGDHRISFKSLLIYGPASASRLKQVLVKNYASSKTSHWNWMSS